MDTVNILFIEMKRPRQSRRIVGVCNMFVWLLGEVLQDALDVEIDDGLGAFF